MNQTSTPMFLRNSAGATLQVYRQDSVDHIRVVVPGDRPLGSVPRDLDRVVVDPD
jgi:hypothetical protein